MRTIISFISALALLSLATLIGCGDEQDTAGVSIVAGTTQLSDLATNVAGDRAEVVGILTANSDPHDYEPRPSDAEALLNADLILQSGGDLDLWLDELVESSDSGAEKLVLLDRVEAIEGEHDQENGEVAHEELDPHWWQNPQNAIVAVEAIRDELIAIDPEGRRDYEANAGAYVSDLERLDRDVATCFDRIPVAERKLVTSHDAMGYYADRYGIEVVGATIPALTTQAQPSAGETAELVETIRETGVSTIFPEAGVTGELEDAIAAEADASVGGELWADTLGPEGSDGATYLEMIESNTAKLVDGFTAGRQTCSIDVHAQG